MLKFAKQTIKNQLNLYLKWICRREFESQIFSRFNERPIEFSFVFRKLGEIYPKTILDVGTGTTALPHLMRNCGYLVTATDNVRDYWSSGMLNRHYHVIDDDKSALGGLKQGVILPKNGIIEVLRIMEGGKSVQIGFKENNFIVKKDEEVLIIRLIEGEFPDYEMVIPKRLRNEMNVQKQDFLMMLRRMSILSSDKYPGVRFKIGKEQLEATATNPEIGESKEIISASYKAKTLEVAFNPKYFTDTLASMESDEVVIKLKDEVNPCTIEGKDDVGFLSVIMPMRV